MPGPLLTRLRYSRRLAMADPGHDGEYVFGGFSLLVGQNSAGKTRSLNAVAELAGVLRGEEPLPAEGDFRAAFGMEGSDPVAVRLGVQDNRLQFLADGAGTGLAVIPEAARRWAAGARHYHFGSATPQGLLFAQALPPEPADDPIDTGQVLHLFEAGLRKVPAFKEEIKAGMEAVGYTIEDIYAAPPPADLAAALPAGARMLVTQETSLDQPTITPRMSQGFYRALIFTIHVVFSCATGRRTAMIIDDFAEGLDHERATAFVEWLRSKTGPAGVQVIASTNNRFVMNAVPLREWVVLRREGRACRIYHRENSREAFDDFGFTGLNNFDFLATDFLGGDDATP